MENTRYEYFGVNFSKEQFKKIVNARNKHADVTIRLTKKNLRGAWRS